VWLNRSLDFLLFTNYFKNDFEAALFAGQKESVLQQLCMEGFFYQIELYLLYKVLFNAVIKNDSRMLNQ
jgi:hypothetical protein